MLFIFIAITNIYYLSLFSASTFKGNKLHIGMFFSTSEVLGVLGAQSLIKYLPDNLAYIVCTSNIIVLNSILRLMDIPETAVLFIILFLICQVGMATNISFILQNTRVDPKLLGMSLEFNYSAGVMTSMAMPFVSKMKEPFPFTVLLMLGVFRSHL